MFPSKNTLKVTSKGFSGLIIVALFFAWIILICLGSIINSQASLDELNNRFSYSSALIFLLSWTWSNVCIASCLSSMLGEAFRVKDSVKEIHIKWLSAGLRGFFVFLTAMAGQLVILGKIDMPQSGGISVPQGFYFRIVGACSLVSFIVGFRPRIILKLFEKIAEQLETHSDKDKDTLQNQETGKGHKGKAT